MVRVCRTPMVAYKTFTPNQLAGWATDGINVGDSMFRPKKKRKKRQVAIVEDRPPPPQQPVVVGKAAKVVSF